MNVVSVVGEYTTVSTNESMHIYAVTPFPSVFHSIALVQGDW